MDMGEGERSSHLETERARAEMDKVARKTEQPQELIAGIEYRKLVVARKQAERKLALARELESANAEQRKQELRLVRSEIAQLTADVARFGKAQADLTIAAPRSGILQIGRASCRESVCQYVSISVVAVSLKIKIPPSQIYNNES